MSFITIQYFLALFESVWGNAGFSGSPGGQVSAREPIVSVCISGFSLLYRMWSGVVGVEVPGSLGHSQLIGRRYASCGHH